MLDNNCDKASNLDKKHAELNESKNEYAIFDKKDAQTVHVLYKPSTLVVKHDKLVLWHHGVGHMSVKG